MCLVLGGGVEGVLVVVGYCEGCSMCSVGRQRWLVGVHFYYYSKFGGLFTLKFLKCEYVSIGGILDLMQGHDVECDKCPKEFVCI